MMRINRITILKNQMNFIRLSSCFRFIAVLEYYWTIFRPWRTFKNGIVRIWLYCKWRRLRLSKMIRYFLLKSLFYFFKHDKWIKSSSSASLLWSRYNSSKRGYRSFTNSFPCLNKTNISINLIRYFEQKKTKKQRAKSSRDSVYQIYPFFRD